MQNMQIIEGVAGTCHYCGAQCDFGASASQPVSVVIPRAITACRECGEDFNDYLQNHMREASSEDQLVRDLEAFMKKRVKERESPE